MKTHAGDLLVADSFRVRLHPRTGRAEVRGLEHHLRRFTGSALAAWEDAADASTADPAPDFEAAPVFDAAPAVEAFLADALPRIAAYGEGFPRLELRAGPSLRLELRPLPELRESIELRTAGRIRLPRAARKGPNIARLIALNRELGAEALLLDERGRAVEGATTSLVWWDAETGQGYAVAGTRDRVDSVTERLIRAAAPIERTRVAPAALAACEVWAVNALHGIRVVERIDGTATRSPDRARLDRLRAALDAAWTPLTDG